MASSRSPSLQSLFNHEEDLLSNHEFEIEADNEYAWINQKLYDSGAMTVGEAVHEILTFFFKNGLTKKCLENLLELLQLLLPRPNNLAKTKYQLLKLLNTLLPTGVDLIKKHQMCQNCSHYLGALSTTRPIKICENCKSTNVNDIFVEFDLRHIIKDAFEVRDLQNLIDRHSKDIENIDENIVSDFTTGSEYKRFRRETLKGRYDVCLIWNTDGAPVSKSSNGQIWPIQVKVINIPPEKRRSYQFLTGLYYTNETKPPMTSFLKPFADTLKDLHENGVEWFNKDTQVMERSIVIAPIATLDCPARAAAQNLMRCNGECGCNTCEHPGMTCYTGAGHNRVYPVLTTRFPLRTQERMLEHANVAVNNSYDHVKGVKGASIAATIPLFDSASSFVNDYMHATLLGVARMLFNLWFDGSSNKKPYYIKKLQKAEIDRAIKEIAPPNFIIRTPRQLKDRKYWKASEIRDFLLFYFPLLLKDKLPSKYYKHFLLLVYGTRILLQDKIHVDDISTAESLLSLFALNVMELYGLEKCSFNVHQLTHMARQVRLWGPLWAWSAFTFEDGIGYFKKMNHGPNKVDMEIVNTLKIFNAYYVLKDKLNIRTFDAELTSQEKLLGKSIKYQLNTHEIEALLGLNVSQESYILPGNSIYCFNRATVGGKTFTSKLYSRQKKRKNCVVCWDNKSKFGVIQFFACINHELYAIVREYVRRLNERNFIHTQISLDLCNVLVPTRLTLCYYALPLKSVDEAMLYVNDCICIQPNMYEKK